MLDKIKELFLGKAVKDTSPALTVNKTDYQKIIVHAAIVGASAALVVIGENLANIDFGTLNALIVPVLSSTLIFIQKWLKDNEPK
jgi:hypothetical protein